MCLSKGYSLSMIVWPCAHTNFDVYGWVGGCGDRVAPTYLLLVDPFFSIYIEVQSPS